MRIPKTWIVPAKTIAHVRLVYLAYIFMLLYKYVQYIIRLFIYYLILYYENLNSTHTYVLLHLDVLFLNAYAINK